MLLGVIGVGHPSEFEIEHPSLSGTRTPVRNAGQVSDITPSLSGITSLIFFKQFDRIFLVFAILSDFQPIYSISRSHDTGNVRPLNRGILKGRGRGRGLEGRVPHWRLRGPSRPKARWSPFPLRPKTGLRALQKTSDFAPAEAPELARALDQEP